MKQNIHINIFYQVIFLFIGLGLIIFSYTSIILGRGIIITLLRGLGSAILIASLISLTLDRIFQKQLENKMISVAEIGAQKINEKVGFLTSDINNITSIAEKIPVMNGCLKSGILNIYEKRSVAENDIIKYINNAKEKVFIMGISLRTFFQGNGKLNNTVKEKLYNVKQKAIWKILVLDPDCEQAKLRSEREEAEGTALEEGTLFREVNSTISEVKGIKRTSKAIDERVHIRKYYGSPSCFLLIIDDVMFIEQYQYGEKGEDECEKKIVGEKVPLLMFKEESDMYKELLGHYTYMWNKLSSPV